MAAVSGAGIGCDTRYEAIADRATAEPPLLSVARGSGPEAAVPSGAPTGEPAPTTAKEAHAQPNGSAAPEAEPARRRRSKRSADPGAAKTDLAQIKVSRLVVARGVSGREPVGVGTSFRTQDLERVFVFVDVANEAREEGEIVVAFAPPGGGPAHRVKLAVGAEPRWRTWATTKRARAPGSWTAIVSTASGRELARAAFVITP
jgi:hypothetical protein